MQKIRHRLTYGIIIGILLTAPLVALSFFLYGVFEFPFLAFDAFDWQARHLPGDVITFGIDTMVDLITTFDLGRTDTTAKFFERVMAVGMLVGYGTFIAALYFAFANRNRRVPHLITGTLVGFSAAIPMILISTSINTSAAVSEALSTVVAFVMFTVWGVTLGWSYQRVNQGTPQPESAPIKASTPMATPASTAAPVETPTVLDLPAADPTPALSAARSPQATLQTISRRQFLLTLGAATASITLSGATLATIFWKEEVIKGGNVDFESFRMGGANFDPAPGTRPEYTPLAKHYRIDISSGRPPRIEEEGYRLVIDGLVNRKANLSLNDIRQNYTRIDQIITMSCISNRVGADLISTTLWSGVSMQDILATVDPKPEAKFIHITSADGFHEYLDIEVIRQDPTVMLTYAWDDVPLPALHGFPLRIHIPSRFGMKQPKWIERMEFVDEWQEGYWVSRGWSKEALVRTTSVVDTVAVNDIFQDSRGQYFVPIGGIAWSGVRGISKVEVRVNGGDWQEAKLRAPLSEKSWVVWRYDWPHQQGEFTFEVRTYEADGTLQIEEVNRTRPDGATGIHSRSANVPVPPQTIEPQSVPPSGVFGG